MSLSGDEDCIIDFLTGIAPVIGYITSHERPLKAVSDRANEYGNKLSVLGVHVPEDGPWKHINTVSPVYSRFELPILGRCAAIGSGAEHIRIVAATFSLDEARNARTIEIGGISELIRGFCGAINNRIIADELFFGINSRNFGGYFEASHFNPEVSKWVRSGRALSLFYVASEEGDKGFKINQIGNALCYDPGGDHARILSIAAANPNVNIVDYDVQNIISQTEVSKVPTDQFWSQWKPVSCTITIICTWQRKNGISTQTLDLEDVGDIEFAFSAEGIVARLSNKAITRIGTGLEEIWNRRFVASE